MALKFNAGHPSRLRHFDLLPLASTGADLIQEIATASRAKESELWEVTRGSTQLRLASLPGELILLLNVWPSNAVAARLAAVFGLPPLTAVGHDWARGLPQLVVALTRTGFTPGSGLVTNPGYQGHGARKGLLNTVHRLVAVPRPGGGTPLLVLAVMNPREGMNFGSCHAPAAAVERGQTAMETAANWSAILETAAGFLRARQVPHPPPLRPPTPTPPPPTHPNHPKAGDKPVGVDGETGGKWGQLRPVREMVRNFRRGDTTSDHVRVANMEKAVGMQLFTLCSLESPFPEALFE